MGWAESLIVAIILIIISTVITIAMTPKPPDAKAAVFEDFDFPQFEEGTPQAVVFGDTWIEDWMVLWYGDFKVQPIRKKSGKK